MNDYDYEKLTYERDINGKELEKALNKTKEFIKINKRILVGGMGIDLALRLHASKLYPDDKFPDYDFISPVFHNDAYKISTILSDTHDDIDVINAFHSSTMKVRYKFYEVADITYVPDNIYENIPIICVNGFTIAHPHYQMLDQHRALSIPFENPPNETINGRWKKDIERYSMLNEFYEIKANKLSYNNLKKYIIPKWDYICLSGPTSLQYWCARAVKELNYKPKYKWLESFDDEFSSPFRLHILLDNFEEKYSDLNNKKIFNPILDKIPKRAENSKMVLLNNNGTLRGAFKDKNYYISNLQEVLCYCGTMGVLMNDKRYINMYVEARSLLLHAAKLYPKNESKPYLPTVDTYGKNNVYSGREIAKQIIKNVIFNKKTIVRGNLIPKRAYLNDGEIPKTHYDFIPENSEILNFNGNQV